MRRTMWFGTREFSRWIKTYSPSPDLTPIGYVGSINYLNGGVGLRRSLSAAETRQLTWNRLTGKQARDIADFASGTYGDGPLYLSDPSANALNVLNKNWSMPALSGKDGVPLAGHTRPELLPNPDQSRQYPIEMAKYSLVPGDPRRTFYLPVPPGHTAWVGAHGDTGSTLGIRVQPTVRGTSAGASSVVDVVSVNTSQRFTDSFAAAGEQSGIELSIEPGAGYVTLAGLIVQVLPTGQAPEAGGFISGQGMSGANFDGPVKATPYSLAHDSYGLSVRLVEIEEWL